MEICKHFINSDSCFRLIVKTDLSETRKILEIHKKANTTKIQNSNTRIGLLTKDEKIISGHKSKDTNLHNKVHIRHSGIFSILQE